MFRKLRGRIIEKYGTIQAFADALGVTGNTITRYLNGTSRFNAERMDRWGRLLDIDRSEYVDYFFA